MLRQWMTRSQNKTSNQPRTRIKPKSARLMLEALEQRDMPSVTSVFTNTPDLKTCFQVTVNCNSNPSNVSIAVTDYDSVQIGKNSYEIAQFTITDSTNNFSKSVWARNTSTTKIVVNGGAKDDTVHNDTAFTSYQYGNGGNDKLYGGSKADYLYGGTGDDTLNGNGGSDYLYGNDGKDTLNGGAGYDHLEGGTGDDTLNGDADGDWLYGNEGNDTLNGGTGNDNLYGGTGSDKLYGQDGSDFLDDGSGVANSSEVNDGGTGFNFAAYQTVLGGTTGSDVKQGTQNTCWILSPIASAAQSGINLKDRITYLGNGQYNVKLMHPNGTSFFEKVSLEGGKYDFEPTPSTSNGIPGAESWVILFQRAILKQFVSDVSDPSTYPSFATSPSSSLPFLTGRSATFQLAGGTYVGSFGFSDIDQVANALAAGKCACAGARQGDFGDFLPGVISVASPKICGSHIYSFVSVDKASKTLVLRNPWGTDVSKDKNGKILHNMTVSGANDGLITLTYQEFVESFAMMSVS